MTNDTDDILSLISEKIQANNYGEREKAYETCKKGLSTSQRKDICELLWRHLIDFKNNFEERDRCSILHILKDARHFNEPDTTIGLYFRKRIGLPDIVILELGNYVAEMLYDIPSYLLLALTLLKELRRNQLRDPRRVLNVMANCTGRILQFKREVINDVSRTAIGEAWRHIERKHKDAVPSLSLLLNENVWNRL